MNTYEEISKKDKELSDKIYDLNNNSISLLKNLVERFRELFADEFRILERNFNEIGLYSISNRLEVIKDDIRNSTADEIIKNNVIKSINRVKEEIVKNNELCNNYNNELLDLMIKKNQREKYLADKKDLLEQKIKELDKLDSKIKTHEEIAYSGLIEDSIKNIALKIVDESISDKEVLKREIYIILKEENLKNDLVLFAPVVFSKDSISKLEERIGYKVFEELEKENNKEYNKTEKKRVIVTSVKKVKEEDSPMIVFPKKIKKEKIDEKEEIDKNINEEVTNTFEDILVNEENYNEISSVARGVSSVKDKKEYEHTDEELIDYPFLIPDEQFDEELIDYPFFIPNESRRVINLHSATESLKRIINLKKIRLGLLAIGSKVISLLTNSNSDRADMDFHEDFDDNDKYKKKIR